MAGEYAFDANLCTTEAHTHTHTFALHTYAANQPGMQPQDTPPQPSPSSPHLRLYRVNDTAVDTEKNRERKKKKSKKERYKERKTKRGRRIHGKERREIKIEGKKKKRKYQERKKEGDTNYTHPQTKYARPSPCRNHKYLKTTDTSAVPPSKAEAPGKDRRVDAPPALMKRLARL